MLFEPRASQRFPVSSPRCTAIVGQLDSTGRMECSHTHFDGYELLAVPLESPASIVVLDSSALVLVQKLLLPDGDSAPRSLTWQPGGARTGCSSGALSCIVSTAGMCTRVCVLPRQFAEAIVQGTSDRRKYMCQSMRQNQHLLVQSTHTSTMHFVATVTSGPVACFVVRAQQATGSSEPIVWHRK